MLLFNIAIYFLLLLQLVGKNDQWVVMAGDLFAVMVVVREKEGENSMYVQLAGGRGGEDVCVRVSVESGW